MDERTARSIATHTHATVEAIMLAELARTKPKPEAYLADLERKAVAGLDAVRVDRDYPELVKHGVLEGIGAAFRSARAWLAQLQDR